MEKDRPGPSYTVETLRILKERRPGADLFLILGGDSLNDLPYWYEPRRIVELATLLIVARPGAEVPPLEDWRKALSARTTSPFTGKLCNVRSSIFPAGSCGKRLPPE